MFTTLIQYHTVPSSLLIFYQLFIHSTDFAIRCQALCSGLRNRKYGGYYPHSHVAQNSGDSLNIYFSSLVLPRIDITHNSLFSHLSIFPTIFHSPTSKTVLLSIHLFPSLPSFLFQLFVLCNFSSLIKHTPGKKRL